MTTDLHDTPLPRFEDRLWNELRDAHEERQRPSVDTPQRPNRRRRPLAIGAAVAVAAATTLVIGLATLPGSEPRQAEASIEERIVAATDATLADSVVHVTTDFVPGSAGQDADTWYDDTTNTHRSRHMTDQGAVLWDRGPAEAPQPGDEAPDLDGYEPSDVVPTSCEPWGDTGAQICDAREWPEGYPTRVERVVQPCDETYADTERAFEPMAFSDLQVRDDLAAGNLVADGTEVIDGRELIRLRDVATAELPDDFAVEQTVYVDPDTYLPVELRSDVGGPDENILRFEYLPRDANLGLLSPPVPDGFTQVDELTPCG